MGVVSSLEACGINWVSPFSHFDGMDGGGRFAIIEKPSELRLATGTIPIFFIFGSENQSASPYLGAGWTIPLLEAKIYQIDENTFRMNQPDGWYRLFWRDSKNPSVLNGQGNWKAEIRGSTITAVAECGSKIVFNDGKITSLEAKGSTLTFVYTNGIISKIRDANTDLLQVNLDSRGKSVSGITLPGKARISLSCDNRPEVQLVNEQKVISKVGKSLSKIAIDGKTFREFEYGVDANLNPTVTRGSQIAIWDPSTKRLMRDGDWTYEYAQQAGHGLTIKRTNGAESESWLDDSQAGKVVIGNPDGSTREIFKFTSGLLSGKTRKIVLSDSVGSNVVYSAVYSENGGLLREVSTEGVTHYDSRSFPVEIANKSGSLKFTYIQTTEK